MTGDQLRAIVREAYHLGGQDGMRRMHYVLPDGECDRLIRRICGGVPPQGPTESQKANAFRRLDLSDTAPPLRAYRAFEEGVKLGQGGAA